MLDVDACFEQAKDMCRFQIRGVDHDKFVETFRDRLDSAGRWFMNNGLARLDKEMSVGWEPRSILADAVDQLLKKKTLSGKLVSKKRLEVLDAPEATQHFTTLLAYMLFIGFLESFWEYRAGPIN